MIAPFGLSQLPETAPPAKVWLAVARPRRARLGIAYLLYFAIIASAARHGRFSSPTSCPPSRSPTAPSSWTRRSPRRRSPARARPRGHSARDGPRPGAFVERQSMTSRYWPLLLMLASLWRASDLFIKIGVAGGFSPGRDDGANADRGRGVVRVSDGDDRHTHAGRPSGGSLAGGDRARVLNARPPSGSIAWGEQHIHSRAAGSPRRRFRSSAADRAQLLPHERIGGGRIAGVLLGSSASPSSRAARRGGTLAVSGRSPLSSRRRSTPPRGSTASSTSGHDLGPGARDGPMLAGALFLLPLAILDPPTSTPTAGAIASLLLLALLGTALAQLLLFRTVRLFGAAGSASSPTCCRGLRSSTERSSSTSASNGSALIGLALILFGVALGSGSLRLRRRRPVPATETTPTG